MKMLKTILSKTSYLALSLVVGIALAAGITFAAWTATWHDPNDWAQSGKTISAQEIAENFEYLYSEKSPNPPTCVGEDSRLQWDGGWICNIIQRGCKVRYRVKTTTDTSDWIETAISGDNNTWKSGGWASVHGSVPNSFSLQMGVMCGRGAQLDFSYLFRTNRGAWRGSTVRSSGSNWSDGNWTQPVPGSCAMRGGNAGCGASLYSISSTGSPTCEVQIKYSDNSDDAKAWSSSTSWTEYRNTCSGDGCGVRMRVRCR